MVEMGWLVQLHALICTDQQDRKGDQPTFQKLNLDPDDSANRGLRAEETL